MQPVVDHNNWNNNYQQMPQAHQQGIPQLSQLRQQAKKDSKFKRLLGVISSVKFLLAVLVLLQVVVLYLVINPINLVNQLSVVQIVNRVASKVSVPPTEVPLVVARVGDSRNLPSAEDLRKENEIQAQVYKDVQNGDYVISYPSKMVIYRESSDTVLYQGDTPRTILEKSQQDIINKVVSKAKAQGIIANNSQEVPQVSSVTDATELKKQNASFYANAINNDIIAVFPTAGKVVIFRATNDTIINSGNFRMNIE